MQHEAEGAMVHERVMELRTLVESGGTLGGIRRPAYRAVERRSGPMRRVPANPPQLESSTKISRS